jgi:hypothetical protein
VVKPGVFRRVLLRGVLWAANLIARTSTHGSLSGIPSIHYAHWALIDRGRRLLFLSNYDGSWESYLGDFIDKASRGLTGVWSNTVGFPVTDYLIFKGADERARNSRGPGLTVVWYRRIPADGPADRSTSTFREGLASERAGALRRWLKSFDNPYTPAAARHSGVSPGRIRSPRLRGLSQFVSSRRAARAAIANLAAA